MRPELQIQTPAVSTGPDKGEGAQAAGVWRAQVRVVAGTVVEGQSGGHADDWKPPVPADLPDNWGHPMNLPATHERPDTSVIAMGGRRMPIPIGRWGADVAEYLLGRLPQAVMLVDSRGAVGALNERAAGIVAQGDGLIICRGVLRCRFPGDTAALHGLISDARGNGQSNCPRGLRIRRPVGRRPLTVLVTVLRDATALASGEAVIAVLVSDPEHAPTIDVQMLRDWYDLTPAEARVATLLASGFSLEEIVERLNIGTNTARTHLKSIFAKTDTGRQGELIRLLLSNPTLGPELAGGEFHQPAGRRGAGRAALRIACQRHNGS